MSKDRVQFINVNKLHFDPDNPRLPSIKQGIDTEKVYEYMIEKANIIELMGSIAETGYFEGEPVLAIPSNEEDSFIVVEGNRRLAAVKLLLDPSLATRKMRTISKISEEATHKPGQIPALIYNNRKEILNYLGYRHITGIKEWDPLQKARYLEQLADSLSIDNEAELHESLAKTIGSKRYYVAQLLTGLNIYRKIKEQEYFDIEDLDEEQIDFSLLTTSLNYSSLSNFLELNSNRDPSLTGLNLDKLETFTNWLFKKNASGKTRVGESRNLKLLSKIVEFDKALEKFEDGDPLEEAVKYTDQPDEIFSISIREAKRELKNANEYIHMVKNPKTHDHEILSEIYRLAENLVFLIKKELDKMTDGTEA